MECPTISCDHGMGWAFYGISGQHSCLFIDFVFVCIDYKHWRQGDVQV